MFFMRSNTSFFPFWLHLFKPSRDTARANKSRSNCNSLIIFYLSFLTTALCSSMMESDFTQFISLINHFRLKIPNCFLWPRQIWFKTVRSQFYAGSWVPHCVINQIVLLYIITATGIVLFLGVNLTTQFQIVLTHQVLCLKVYQMYQPAHFASLAVCAFNWDASAALATLCSCFSTVEESHLIKSIGKGGGTTRDYSYWGE